MKRWQLISAILLALFLTAALALLLLRPNRAPSEKKGPYLPLSTMQMRDVVRFTVRGADGSETRLERDELNAWFITAPVFQRADQGIVVYLLEDLLGIESSAPAPIAELNLADLGLITPSASLSFGLRNGEERTIWVGLPEPRALSYYVRLGDSVYLFPWDVVERALRFLTILPLPKPPTPTGSSPAGRVQVAWGHRL